MRRNFIPLIVIAAALCACGAESELLNSERIEAQFGSYGIEVLDQQAGLRRSNLYSIEAGDPVCRTYALVRFSDMLEPDIAAAHARVIAGDSIGATFRESGWAIEKKTLYIGRLQLVEPGHELARLMRVDAPQPLALHIYRLRLIKAGTVIDYATIAETHHPDYLSENALRAIYPIEIGNASSDDVIAELKHLILNRD